MRDKKFYDSVNHTLKNVFEQYLRHEIQWDQLNICMMDTLSEFNAEEIQYIVNTPTPLLPLSIVTGQVGLVGFLLNSQANPNLDYLGQHPLKRAASINSKEMLALLLRKGAQCNDCEGLSIQACQLMIDSLYNNGQEKHAGAIRNALDYQWRLYNQQNPTINREIETEIDLVIAIGPDNPNCFDSQIQIINILQQAKNNNLKVHIVGDGKNYINAEQLNNLPKSKNVILTGHGMVSKNPNNISKHTIEMISDLPNTMDVAKLFQEKTACKNIITTPCFGGKLIDDLKKENPLKPGTNVFVASPSDEESFVRKSHELVNMILLQMGEDKDLNMLKFVQNYVEKIPETHCFIHIPESNSDKPLESVTLQVKDKVKDKLFVQCSEFTAHLLSEFNEYINNLSKNGLASGLENELTSLVLDDNGQAETNRHKIKEKRAQTPGYQSRIEYYKNDELNHHVGKNHSEVLSYFFKNWFSDSKKYFAMNCMDEIVFENNPKSLFALCPVLIEGGASIYQYYTYYNKPIRILDYAIETNNYQLMLGLVATNERDKNGLFPLDLVLQQQNMTGCYNIVVIVFLLNNPAISHTDHPNTRDALTGLLCKEIIKEPFSLDAINTLIAAGADVNKMAMLPVGHSLLTFAIAKKNTELVESLIKNHARVNYRMDNQIGNSPLAICLKQTPVNLVMVKKLIESGAKLLQKNKLDETPLDIISSLKDRDIKRDIEHMIIEIQEKKLQDKGLSISEYYKKAVNNLRNNENDKNNYTPNN